MSSSVSNSSRFHNVLTGIERYRKCHWENGKFGTACLIVGEKSSRLEATVLAMASCLLLELVRSNATTPRLFIARLRWR